MSALLSFIIGAKYRINFCYKFFNYKNCGFLNTISVQVDVKKHDVEKNLDLLRVCNLKVYSKKLFIATKKDDEKHSVIYKAR